MLIVQVKMATRNCEPCQYRDECWSDRPTEATLEDITQFVDSEVGGENLYIGVTSSDNDCESAMRARRSALVKDLGSINVMIGVYKSKSADRASRCRKVKDHLIDEFDLQQLSRLEETGKPYQYVFVATLWVDYIDETKTNGDNLKQRISAYIRKDRIEKFYIGITSGNDCIKALKGRRSGDSYKTCHDINQMIGLFKSRNQDVCRDLEAELIDFYKTDERIINRTGGGGGPYGAGPWYFLYLGLNVSL